MSAGLVLAGTTVSSLKRSISQVTSSNARLAQSVEHGTLNPRVVGSSPTSGDLFTFFFTAAENAIPMYNVRALSFFADFVSLQFRSHVHMPPNQRGNVAVRLIRRPVLRQGSIAFSKGTF